MERLKQIMNVSVAQCNHIDGRDGDMDTALVYVFGLLTLRRLP